MIFSLSSFLGGKVSTNLGAIHCQNRLLYRHRLKDRAQNDSAPARAPIPVLSSHNPHQARPHTVNPATNFYAAG